MSDDTVTNDNSNVEELYNQYQEQVGADSAISKQDFEEALVAAFPDSQDEGYNTSIFSDFGESLGKALFGEDYVFDSDNDSDTFVSSLREIAQGDGNPDDISLSDLGISAEEIETMLDESGVDGTIDLDAFEIVATHARNTGNYDASNSEIAAALAAAVGMNPEDIYEQPALSELSQKEPGEITAELQEAIDNGDTETITTILTDENISPDKWSEILGGVSAPADGTTYSVEGKTSEEIAGDLQTALEEGNTSLVQAILSSGISMEQFGDVVSQLPSPEVNKEYSAEFKALVEQLFEQNSDALYRYNTYGKGSGQLDGYIAAGQDVPSDGERSLGELVVAGIQAEHPNDPNAVTDELLTILSNMACDGLSTNDMLSVTYTAPPKNEGQDEAQMTREPEPAVSDPAGEQFDTEQLQDSMAEFNRLITADPPDEQAIQSYLDNLTPAQLVQVMNKYEGTSDNGSFADYLNIHLSMAGVSQEAIMTTIATKLNVAAQSSNENIKQGAISTIARELHNATAGTFMHTADEFVFAIIENADPEVLADVLDNATNRGFNLIADIQDDFNENEAAYLISKLTGASPDTALNAAGDTSGTYQTPTVDGQVDIARAADMLRDSMQSGDYETINSMLQDTNISPAEWTEIISTFNETGASSGNTRYRFLDSVSSITSPFTETQKMTIISSVTSKLNEAALSEDTDVAAKAVSILSQDLYVAMQYSEAYDNVVSTILNNCSDSVIVQIANNYDSMPGTDSRGLTWDIRKCFSDQIDSKLVNRINDALINEAQNGATPEAKKAAVEAICNTLYKSMLGAGTDEDTVTYLINNCPPEVMAQVVNQYQSSSRSGNSLEHDIKSDFSVFSGESSLLRTIETKQKEAFNSWQYDASTKTMAGQAVDDFQMFNFDASTYSSDLLAFSQQNIAQYDEDQDGEWNFEEFYAMAIDGIEIPEGMEDVYKGMFQYIFDNMQFDDESKTITAQEYAVQLFAGDVDMKSFMESISGQENSSELFSKLASCLDGAINFLQYQQKDDFGYEYYDQLKQLQSIFYTSFYKNNGTQ